MLFVTEVYTTPIAQCWSKAAQSRETQKIWLFYLLYTLLSDQLRAFEQGPSVKGWQPCWEHWAKTNQRLDTANGWIFSEVRAHLVIYHSWHSSVYFCKWQKPDGTSTLTSYCLESISSSPQPSLACKPRLSLDLPVIQSPLLHLDYTLWNTTLDGK